MLAFDEAKDAANRRKHGLSLAQFADLSDLMFVEDRRYDHGEQRWLVFVGWPSAFASR